MKTNKVVGNSEQKPAAKQPAQSKVMGRPKKEPYKTVDVSLSLRALDVLSQIKTLEGLDRTNAIEAAVFEYGQRRGLKAEG